MFRFDPAVHYRRSIRVKEYDYSQAGSYFITACTKNRECILGTMTVLGYRHLARLLPDNGSICQIDSRT